MRHLNSVSRAAGLAVLFAGVSGAAFAQAPAPADPRDAKIDQLEQAVQDLAAQVADLKRGQAAQITTIQTIQDKTPPPPSVVTSFVNGRPSFASADGRFSATLHGVMQLDTGAFDQSSPGRTTTDLRRDGPALGTTVTSPGDSLRARDLKSGTIFRRARLGLDGTAFGDFDYRFLLDFGGSGVENAGQIYETWVQYNGLKPVHLRVGAFAPSMGLDDQGSTNGMSFIERAGPSDAARNLAGGDTRIAGQAFGYGDHWFASAAVTGRTVGVINTGTASATNVTYGDQLGFVARVAGTPLHGKDWLVHVGAHGSYVARPADASGPTNTDGSTPASSATVAFSDTPELRVDGTKLIDTGKIAAKSAGTAGLEFAAQSQNLLLQGEYEYLEVQRNTPGLSSPHFSGFYVAGTWMVTGETRKYNTATAAFDAPPVAHPFSLKDGTWGAWELGVRYSDLNLNYHEGDAGKAPAADAIRGGDQRIWTAGVNWYLNPIVRFVLDVQHVQIDRLSPSAITFSTPVGAQIGQTYNAVALRSQVAF